MTVRMVLVESCLLFGKCLGCLLGLFGIGPFPPKDTKTNMSRSTTPNSKSSPFFDVNQRVFCELFILFAHQGTKRAKPSLVPIGPR